LVSPSVRRNNATGRRGLRLSYITSLGGEYGQAERRGMLLDLIAGEGKGGRWRGKGEKKRGTV